MNAMTGESMLRFFRLLFIFILLVFTTSLWAGEPVRVELRRNEPRPSQELLVKFKPGSGLQPAERSLDGIPRLNVARVPLPAGRRTMAAVQTWSQDPRVAWVQPNHWRYALAGEVVPNDVYYRPERNQRRYQQWYLPKINANYAWSLSRGSNSIIIAVIDSGIDLNHPDLRENLMPGVTIVNQDNYNPPANGMDDNGHGTHVAGLIAAVSNNGRGICGTAWSARLLPVKVLNNNGEGTDRDIIEGILYAVDAGARIINLSLGAAGEAPPGLQEAVNYAHDRNCIVIAASGNSGDNSLFYPASLNFVLSVAATDPFDRRAPYSTFNAQVDLAAPGGLATDKETGILSTFWDSSSVIADQMTGSEAGQYAISIGTSMSAGIVSGAAGVVAAHRPDLNGEGIANLLVNTASHAGVSNQETGSGVIDLLNALQGGVTTPAPLTLYFYPNPFNPDQSAGTRIVFVLDEPQPVTLRIYDTSRDLVWEKSLAAHETFAGKNYITWDGRNGMGQTVANGAYFCRLTGSGNRASSIKVIAVLR